MLINTTITDNTIFIMTQKSLMMSRQMCLEPYVCEGCAGKGNSHFQQNPCRTDAHHCAGTPHSPGLGPQYHGLDFG